MELTGKIIKIFPAKIFKDKDGNEKGQVQEFVLEIGDKYPQKILLQSNNANKFNDLSKQKVGDNINVKYNLRGREWTSPQGEVKYINSIDVWSIFNTVQDTKQQEKNEENVAPLLSKNSQTLAESLGLELDSDDLPF